MQANKGYNQPQQPVRRIQMVVVQEGDLETPFLAFRPTNDPKAGGQIFGRVHQDATDKHLAYKMVYFRTMEDRQAMKMGGEEFNWCCRIDTGKVEQAHRRR